MIKAVVFDADGTLLDSMKIWRDAAPRFLLKSGLNVIPGLSDKVFDMSFSEGCEYICRLYPGLTPDSVGRGVSAELNSFYKHEVALTHGARELIAALSVRELPMAVATEGIREMLESAFSRLGILDYFHGLFICSEHKTTKDSPLIYKLAVESLGVRPSETLVFEDTLRAVSTASEAGFHTAAVAEAESAQNRDSIEKKADIFLNSLSEIDKVLRLIERL